jgi:hypothetical protein
MPLGKSESGRDLDRAAIWTTAEKLGKRYRPNSLTVRGKTRFSFFKWTRTEGIQVVDNWTQIFEPVRTRALFGGRWREVQSLQEAASKVGWFLRERPDVPTQVAGD